MPQTRIAGFHLEIGLRSRQFRREAQRNIRQVRRYSRQLNQSFSSVARVTAIASAAAVAALATLTRAALENGDQIAKAARSATLSAESYQRLAFTFNQVGLGGENVTKTIGALARAVLQARDGLATYVREFDRLGISVSELDNLSLEEIFFRVAEGIGMLDDDTTRLATAMTLLGRAGKDSGTLLQLAADGGLRTYSNRLEQVGGIITGDLARIEEFNDNIDLLATTINARFASGLINVLEQVAPTAEEVNLVVREIGDAFQIAGELAGNLVNELLTNEQLLDDINDVLLVFVGLWATYTTLQVANALIGLTTALGRLSVALLAYPPVLIAVVASFVTLIAVSEEFRNVALALVDALTAPERLRNIAREQQRLYRENIRLGEEELRIRNQLNAEIESGINTASQQRTVDQLRQQLLTTQNQIESNARSFVQLNAAAQATQGALPRVGEVIGDNILTALREGGQLVASGLEAVFQPVIANLRSNLPELGTVSAQTAEAVAQATQAGSVLTAPPGLVGPVDVQAMTLDQLSAQARAAQGLGGVGASAQQQFGMDFAADLRSGLSASLQQGDFSELGDILVNRIQVGIGDRFADAVVNILGGAFDSIVSNLQGRSGALGAIGNFLGGFQQGTDFVPQDGFAFLHRGEAVIPANENRGAQVQLVYQPVIRGDTGPELLRDLNRNATEVVALVESGLRQRGSL